MILISEKSKASQEGVVGIFGFAELANFWLDFSVFAIKNCGFSVLVSFPVCGFFSNLVFGFRFLSTMMVVSAFSIQTAAFYGFSGFAKEVTPCSRAKIIIPRDHLAFYPFF